MEDGDSRSSTIANRRESAWSLKGFRKLSPISRQVKRHSPFLRIWSQVRRHDPDESGFLQAACVSQTSFPFAASAPKPRARETRAGLFLAYEKPVERIITLGVLCSL